MQRVLLKRTFRDLKANFLRYLALFLLIVLCVSMIVGIVGSSQSVIWSVAASARENLVEDGEFSVFIPLTDQETQSVEEMGAVLEESFYLDFSMADSSTIRVMKNRNSVNLVVLSEGCLPGTDTQVVIERVYAVAHGLSVGDIVEIGGISFEICGIGTTPDYDCCYENLSDVSADGQTFGTAFVSDEAYGQLKNCGQALHSEEYYYSYRLTGNCTEAELKEYLQSLTVSSDAIDNVFFQEMLTAETADRDKLTGAIEALLEGVTELTDGAEQMSEKMEEFQNSVDDFLEEYFSDEINNLIDFIPAQDNPRIGASADDALVNVNVGLLAGVIILLLIAYVISVFVIHSIDHESEVIGALYALGVKEKQLIPQYTLLPVFLCLLGGILGTALGYSKASVSFFAADTISYYSIVGIRTYYAPLLLLYGVGVPPIIAFVVNTVVIHKRLNQTALSLLRKEGKPERGRRRAKAKPEKRNNQSKAGFIRTFQFRQLFREKRSLFALLAGLFVSLLVLMIGLNCYALCENLWSNNRSDVTYGYQYIYKYPTDEVPEGGYEAYIVSLKKEILGYNMEIRVIGLTDTNPYFPKIPEMEQNEIVLASSTASKYGLGVGDQLILSDDVNDTYYYFTVKGVVDYSVGLCAFMNIDNMRKLFCVDEDYYNVVYSDTALDIDAGRLYSVSTGEEVAESTEIFINIMSSLIYSMIFGAAAILLIVMYQMVKVMLDRSEQHISLLKIFGYKNKEIRRLYLDGNFLMLAVVTPFLIVFAKQIMDCIYPYLVSNVACGIYLAWEPWLYVAVYASILVSFLLIRELLMIKIKNNKPIETLKNRD